MKSRQIEIDGQWIRYKGDGASEPRVFIGTLDTSSSAPSLKIREAKFGDQVMWYRDSNGDVRRIDQASPNTATVASSTSVVYIPNSTQLRFGTGSSDLRVVGDQEIPQTPDISASGGTQQFPSIDIDVNNFSTVETGFLSQFFYVEYRESSGTATFTRSGPQTVSSTVTLGLLGDELDEGTLYDVRLINEVVNINGLSSEVQSNLVSNVEATAAASPITNNPENLTVDADSLTEPFPVKAIATWDNTENVDGIEINWQRNGIAIADDEIGFAGETTNQNPPRRTEEIIEEGDEVQFELRYFNDGSTGRVTGDWVSATAIIGLQFFTSYTPNPGTYTGDQSFSFSASHNSAQLLFIRLEQSVNGGSFTTITESLVDDTTTVDSNIITLFENNTYQFRATLFTEEGGDVLDQRTESYTIEEETLDINLSPNTIEFDNVDEGFNVENENFTVSNNGSSTETVTLDIVGSQPDAFRLIINGDNEDQGPVNIVLNSSESQQHVVSLVGSGPTGQVSADLRAQVGGVSQDFILLNGTVIADDDGDDGGDDGGGSDGGGDGVELQ